MPQKITFFSFFIFAIEMVILEWFLVKHDHRAQRVSPEISNPILEGFRGV